MSDYLEEAKQLHALAVSKPAREVGRYASLSIAASLIALVELLNEPAEDVQEQRWSDRFEAATPLFHDPALDDTVRRPRLAPPAGPWGAA